MDDEKRIGDTVHISELLEQILDELRESNSRNRDLEERIKCLESKEEVLSIGEAAEYVGRTRQTISAWIAQGKIKKVVMGCRTGLLKSELKRIR